ncbi:MAG: DUF4097 family beta strand repeat protein [Acidobacteria bacterium]|nr:DUF4097 family beta strand repeat protein [Acidobacteriota bacterium]
MSSRVMRGGLAAGVVLILFGALFLVHNLYAPFSVWRLLARYWPLLLVGFGLWRLWGHFTWRPGAPEAEAAGAPAARPKAPRPPSLLGALLWTSLGLLFFAHNLGAGPDVWQLASRWWPLLLILLGIGKLVDYALHREGVAVRAGELVGILALVLAGSAVSRLEKSPIREIMRDARIEIGEARVRPGEWLGTSHAYSEDRSYPQERVRPVRIENSYGSVSVLPGPDGEISVRLGKVIFAPEAEAAGIAGEIRLETAEGAPGGDAFVIRTNRDLLADRKLRFHTNLEVRVPGKTRVEVRNAFGEIRVSDIHGGLDLATTHRGIEVADSTGPFTLSTRYAETRLTNLEGDVQLDSRGKVYAENIRGNMTVKDEYSPVELVHIEGALTLSGVDGSIRVENVSGPAVIEARGAQVTARALKGGLRLAASHARADLAGIGAGLFVESRYGTLTLKEIRGGVELASLSDRISAEGIEGDFRMRGRSSSLRLDGIRGNADVETSLGDLVVRDLQGAASLVNSHGAIHLTARAPLGALDIRNQGGPIALTLPAGARFSLAARARNGSIRAPYPGLPAPVAEGGGTRLETEVQGGGPAVALETVNGDIVIDGNQGAPPRTRGGDVL